MVKKLITWDFFVAFRSGVMNCFRKMLFLSRDGQ